MGKPGLLWRQRGFLPLTQEEPDLGDLEAREKVRKGHGEELGSGIQLPSSPSDSNTVAPI